MKFLTMPVMYALIAIAVAALAFGGVQSYRLANAKAKHSQTLTKIAELTRIASEKVRLFEQHHAAALDAVAKQHQEDLRNAQATYDRTVADVRSGALILQNRWSCPAANVPRVAAGAGEPDGAADDRAESAARIIQAAAECDAQVRGLQKVTQVDRTGPKP